MFAFLVGLGVLFLLSGFGGGFKEDFGSILDFGGGGLGSFCSFVVGLLGVLLPLAVGMFLSFDLKQEKWSEKDNSVRAAKVI